MLDLGLVGFTQPWLLAALVALPAVWLLLRVTPPSPRRQAFPPLRLLLGLERREETPARTPPWLLILRLLLASLLILALAGPVLDPSPRLAGPGRVLLVVDDGWAAGPDWRERQTVLDSLLEQGERDAREVLLLRTAPSSTPIQLQQLPASEARRQLSGWQPHPWPADRVAALTTLRDLPDNSLTPIWLTDGVAETPEARAAAGALAARLAALGPLRVLSPAADFQTRLLLPPAPESTSLNVSALRPESGTDERLTARAVGPQGEVLGQAELVFSAADTRAQAVFDLPIDLQNRVARIELAGEHGIGGTVLLDERWRRRTVGLVGTAQGGVDQPLLAELYFIERAMAPFAELRRGQLAGLLEQPMSMVVLTDTGKLPDAERDKLASWVEAGGVLLRFAGPRLAQAADDLVPVPLRQGDRQLGGALTWSEPLPLAPFPKDGPFAGLTASPEVRVSRQVLSEPGPALSAATLAALSDGTPLVTGRREGKGWMVLVHTSANTAWSNLALSGVFVEMLRRTLALAPGVGGTSLGMLELQAMLDANGRLVEPLPGIPPAAAAAMAEQKPGPSHPPGLWGPAAARDDRESDRARTAFNLQSSVQQLLPLDQTVIGRPVETLTAGGDRDLAPWLLGGALLLALVDLLCAYALRGLVPAWRLRGAAAAAVLLALTALPVQAQQAQPSSADPMTMAGAYETKLAFVVTGDGEQDELSRAGLFGLGRILAMRTSVETGDPVGVDPERDELAVYPLVYWPVTVGHPILPRPALERIGRYLKGGGMMLIDTKDAGTLFPGQQGGGPGEQRLGMIMAGMDLPPLAQVPPDHVITRSFYLMADMPGRFTGQPVWIDQVPANLNDGVSSLIIGGNDWAGAWAEDEQGRPLLPVVPGGEQQREMARRFGVNLVMYALTGNYKTDQVHVPALLERLGQ